MFTSEDKKLFESLEISVSEAERQVEALKSGTKYVNLAGAALIGNGIFQPRDCIDKFQDIYENQKNSKKISCFVPASGAATRMFESLINYLSSAEQSSDNFEELKSQTEFYSVGNTLKNINNFAFADVIASILNLAKPIEPNSDNFVDILKAIIAPDALNYADLPKGLILFHKYKDHDRTAFEEHIEESLKYALVNNSLNLHFTVSEENLDDFKTLANSFIPYYKEMGIDLKIDFSVQMLKTNTLAIDENENLIRNSNGELLLRPGGHGALIENLNDIFADLIFIKNIDNIVPDRLKDETAKYKKFLAGILLSITDKVFEFLEKIDKNECIEDYIDEITEYAADFLKLDVPSYDLSLDERKKHLASILNKPIRVCAMVANTGEPGGGPFWIKNSDGDASLQIIEKSQININNHEQREILEDSTHFNPVDMVCCPINYKGEKFNLLDFRDDETYFVASKSHNGKELRALELPGLWNGAMAEWISVFVELPLITFNPVKEINDLLRPEHQNY